MARSAKNGKKAVNARVTRYKKLIADNDTETIASRFAREHGLTEAQQGGLEESIDGNPAEWIMLLRSLRKRSSDAIPALHDLYIALLQESMGNADIDDIMGYLREARSAPSCLGDERCAAIMRTIIEHTGFSLDVLGEVTEQKAPGMSAPAIDVVLDFAEREIADRCDVCMFFDIYASKEAGLLPGHHTRILEFAENVFKSNDDEALDEGDRRGLLAYGMLAKGLLPEHHGRIIALFLATCVNDAQRKNFLDTYLKRAKFSPQVRAEVARAVAVRFRNDLYEMMKVPAPPAFDADMIFV